MRTSRTTDHGPKLILAFGAVMTFALLIFVLRQLPPRDAVVERISPVFADVLPAGAVVASNEVELAALPQSSYVIAFRDGDTVQLAMVSWDRNEHRFALAGTVDLGEGAPRITGPVYLTTEPLGVNSPVAILASGSVGAYAQATFVTVRDGTGLRVTRVTGRDGSVGPAFFLSGASAQHGEKFTLGDADGDGDKDAVQETTTVDAEGMPHLAVAAYAWQDGAFAYDERLSETLTLRKSVFPEPEPEPEVAEETGVVPE